MTRLSKYFTLEEMTASETAVRRGLDNTPGAEELENLKALCVAVLDPIRVLAHSPIIISSGYRSPQVNTRIGGARTSQHCKGEAADIKCVGLSQPQLFNLIRTSGLEFDQLIDEFGSWTHISYTRHRPNRRQVLIARKVGGKTTYTLHAL